MSKDGKKLIADGTYKASKKLAKPDGLESKELNNFKSQTLSKLTPVSSTI